MNRYLETIKILDQKTYNLEYHQKRVDNTIGKGKLNLASIVVASQKELTRCRLVYDEHGEYSIEYIPYTKKDIRRLKLVFDDTIEYGRKYEDREHLNQLFSLKDGCDDVLIIKNGLVADTTIANIAFFDGDLWLTPKQPLLEGTMRAKLLEEKKIFPTQIYYKDIPKFKKIALMNAMVDFDIITQEKIEDIIC